MPLRWKTVTAIMLGLLLGSVARPVTAQTERRWLADPELLVRRKVIGPDAGLLTQVADHIYDLELIDQRNGWAVAYSGLLRFDGRFWRPFLNTGNRVALVAIDLSSTTQGWVVGSQHGGSGLPNVYAARFDGTGLIPVSEVVRSDGTTGVLSGRLVDVAVQSNSTAIAVSSAYESGDQQPGTSYRERPLVLVFDGSVWRDQTPAEWQHGRLNNLSMTSGGEGWASAVLGQSGGPGGTIMRPAIVHLKDGRWTEDPLPPLPAVPGFTLYNVTMRDATEGWALFAEILGQCTRTRLLHAIGGQWVDATPAQQPLTGSTKLELIPGTNRGWASLAGCPSTGQAPPELRMRFDNGRLVPDPSGTRLVPDEYALLSDEVQWASSGGAMLRYSAETLPTARVANVEPNARYFSTTGHTLGAPFRRYYETHGLNLGDPGISERESLALFGFPISEPFPEINPDTGEVLTVQYFERARMEHHPNNAEPYTVLLGRLGANTVIQRGMQDLPATPANPDCQTFAETPHGLCPPFRNFWHTSGGLPVFGFPITPARNERSATDNQTYQTQWFERERLEYHPENRGTPYEVLLGLLAAEELRIRGYLP